MSSPVTCPRCALTDRVEHDPGLRSFGSYWCARCSLPFAGTDEEFVAMGRTRQKYRDAQQQRTVPDGVKP